MAQSASAIFDKIASQYATHADKNDFIALARDRTSTCFYGTNYEYAVALLAAHLLTLADPDSAQGGGSGSIKSKKEGDLSITYGGVNSSNKNDDLASTQYGIQLQNLRKESGMFIGVTGGCDDGCY